MKINFIDLAIQYNLHKDEFKEAVEQVLESTTFINGQQVRELENILSEYVGVKHAIAVSSGTDALLLALLAHGVKRGDEIITTPFTFFATAEVILWLGATPVFVDICHDTYNIDSRRIEKVITSRTKGILPVNLFGQCCHYDEINAIALKNRLFVLEDAAQSFGATYQSRKSCSLSDTSATSFYPPKPLGCYGDGGMVFTYDDGIALKVRQYKDHGQDDRYSHKYIGINGRLDTIQAAILLVKAKYINKDIKLRQGKADYYTQRLKELVVTPVIEQYNKSAYAQYSIRVPNREAFVKNMREKGIPTAIHYPKPVYLQPALSFMGHKEGDFPVCESVANDIVSIPFFPEMEQEEQDYIIDAIKEIVS